MAKYIKKKDLKRALEVCTWYHINKNGELVEGAGLDDEPLYKESDIWRIIKDLPTRKIKDKAIADTPQSCFDCDHYEPKGWCNLFEDTVSPNYKCRRKGVANEKSVQRV